MPSEWLGSSGRRLNLFRPLPHQLACVMALTGLYERFSYAVD